MTTRYGALLAGPGVVRVAVPSVLARLPLGMTTLALLLLVHQQHGSFGLAGAVTACFALASGVTSPLRGRAVDRLGATPVLVVTGLLQPVALVALVVATETGGTGPLLLTAAAVGVLLPPVGPAVRVLWQRLPTAELRRAAFALDAVVLQVIYYGVGPPLVTLLVVLMSPPAAVHTIAGLTLVGTLLVASAPAVRGWPRTDDSAGWWGARAAPGMALVLVVVVVAAAAVGALEVAVTAFATDHGVGDLSGLLLGVLGLGSIAGGLWYGRRAVHHSLTSQYRFWLGALAIGFVPSLAAPGPTALAATLFVAGWAIAPTSVVQFTVVGALAPAGHVAEAFTWLLSASQAGTALGNAVSGLTVEAAGARYAMLAAVGLAAVAYLVSLAAPSRMRTVVDAADA